jgi:hypothetical protein
MQNRSNNIQHLDRLRIILSMHCDTQKKVEEADRLFGETQESMFGVNQPIPDRVIAKVAKAIRATQKALNNTAGLFEGINDPAFAPSLIEPVSKEFIQLVLGKIMYDLEKLREYSEALNEFADTVLEKEKTIPDTQSKRFRRALIRMLGIHRTDNKEDGALWVGMLTGFLIGLSIYVLGAVLGSTGVLPVAVGVVLVGLVAGAAMGITSGFTAFGLADMLFNRYFSRLTDINYLEKHQEKHQAAERNNKTPNATSSKIIEALGMLGVKMTGESVVPTYQESQQQVHSLFAEAQRVNAAEKTNLSANRNSQQTQQPPAYDYDANRQFFGYKS